jgi:hypothetical protein
MVRSTLRPVAVWLQAAAVVAATAGAAYALFLKAVFEPTGDALYAATVGSRLLPVTALAAGIVVAGVAASRPRLLGPNAYAVAAVAALISLGLSLVAEVHAYSQLHPSFQAERSAIAQFVLPPGVISLSTTTEVTANPTISRDWNIGGRPASVCGDAQASLTAWADPGSVQPATRPTPGCSFVARRGADQVKLYGVFLPNDNRVSLSLSLTRQK